jgi:GTP-binding protein
MFVDTAQVLLKAGDGGDGYVSFRQEKFVDKGGPDGGDGGNGGDVILRASRNQNTLAQFRFQKQISADDGQKGFKQNMHGRSGKDLIVDVPVGTVLTHQDGTMLADLTIDGQEVIVAHGGRGGFGNAHFKSSRRQAPRVAEKGEKGDDYKATLELKMIADVGLIGLPNAGKSTFLSVVSNAKPEIADYPFTTVVPNLGMVDIDDHMSLLLADIPGLIEGASVGKGLGDAFLRHVERTNVLLHLIDAYQEDLSKAYVTIQTELKEYKVDLSTKKQIVALTKVEGLDDEMIADRLAELQKVVPAGTELIAISSQTGKNVKELLYVLKDIVKADRLTRSETTEPYDGLPVIRIDAAKEHSWTITKEGNRFIVSGRKIEKFAERTHFDDYHGLQRLRDIMRKMGIMNELDRKGIAAGSVIQIGKVSRGDFTY